MSERNQNHASSGSSWGRREPQQEQRTTKRRRRKGSVVGTIFKRFFQALGTLLLIGIVTGSFLACYAAVYIKATIMPGATLDLSAYTLNENSVIYYYDDNGNPVEWVTLKGLENREWVDYEDIPQDLIDAFVSIEDERFWQHQGVDWYRTAGAFVNMFISMRNDFGGSTITQQLVKNMTQYDDVTVSRKIQEIFTALDVERNYKKEEILEHYLNLIFFGNGCYGVQAAAKFYFDKDVSELTLAECASLAGITNNPSLYSPNAALSIARYRCLDCEKNQSIKVYAPSNDQENPCAYCGGTHYEKEIWTGREYNAYRQTLILGKMADPEISPNGAYITQAEYDAAKAEPLVFSWDEQSAGDDTGDDDPEDVTIYPWYVDAVISEVISDLMETTGLTRDVVTQMVYSGGLSIYVPYDPDVQAKVDQIYNDPANLPYTSKTGQQMSSAITVIDNSTGWVVAMAGGIGEKTLNRGWNNAVSTQPPGSSIKPLSVYSPALEMGLITPATVVDDNPMILENGPGEEDDTVWPTNAPARYQGLTTVLSGVVRSVNTIAVKVLDQVTPQLSYEFMTQRYGFTTLEEGRWKNDQYKSDIDRAPLSMGGLTDGVTTVEMAAAYATFPRNGAHTEATTYLLIKDIDGNVLIDNTPSTSYVIKDSTAYYINSMLTNAVTSGTGTRAQISGQTVAGKTGTTSNMFDLYFVGYTSYYTAAVWTGYPYDEDMGNIANPSVTLWQKVMALVHEGLPQQDFVVPDKVQSYNICRDCGKLATSECANDLRGSRVQTFSLLKSDAPTEFCSCHVTVTICTECPILDANGKETGAYHLATEHCPAESVKEVTMVNYVRELAREDVYVEDYYALMSIYDTLEDPYCTVHEAPVEDPVDPWDPGTDPDPDVSDSPWWDFDWDWPWNGDDDDEEPTPTPTPGVDVPVEPTDPPMTD